ncbi:PEPxxWA-CTERM sorting domain-containing protein [Sandaracinobacter sp.]|jgi:hypothetical protein|uniref:PEPxxWA-CTERM sorting domain-containing protein n=1 Tax=Sandaracinobacter sp. TaxID=2487581 RepID=UPI0035B06C27
MKHVLMAGAFACAALFSASGASAAVAVNYNNCGTAGVFDAPFSYSSCAGGYEKNVLNNSTDGVDSQKAALQALGFDTSGFDFNSYFKIDGLGGADVTSPPAPLMKGITIFGIHFGNSSVLGNATAFYKFDAGAGTTTIPFATKGSSGFVLYQTGDGGDVVPEPATWAMMIAGFGLVGSAMRRRRTVAVSA